MLSVLQLDHIELLKNIHLSCNTSADDIDEPKYTLQKKLSEVINRIICFDGRVLTF
jgi:exportin-5